MSDVAEGEGNAFHHPVEVRFRDIDAGGHAHHTLPLVYFEEARSAYWSRVVGRDGLEGIDYILAEATVRYHRRILWPQTVTVALRVPEIGRSHWIMEYVVRGEDGARLATGETRQVMYDYEAGRPVRIPDDVRGRMRSRDDTAG